MSGNVIFTVYPCNACSYGIPTSGLSLPDLSLSSPGPASSATHTGTLQPLGKENLNVQYFVSSSLFTLESMLVWCLTQPKNKTISMVT